MGFVIFYLSEKNEQIILSILTLFNGALYHCTILYVYLIQRARVCNQPPLPQKNSALPLALIIGLLVCISRLLTWMGFCCPLHDQSIVPCIFFYL